MLGPFIATTLLKMNPIFAKSEYKQYADFQDDLMQHFKEYLPRNIYTLSYEKLIDQTPKELNKVLNFLYQKFEPECLEFYKLRDQSLQLVKHK